jgi:hypothetical protein
VSSRSDDHELRFRSPQQHLGQDLVDEVEKCVVVREIVVGAEEKHLVGLDRGLGHRELFDIHSVRHDRGGGAARALAEQLSIPIRGQDYAVEAAPSSLLFSPQFPPIQRVVHAPGQAFCGADRATLQIVLDVVLVQHDHRAIVRSGERKGAELHEFDLNDIVILLRELLIQLLLKVFAALNLQVLETTQRQQGT